MKKDFSETLKELRIKAGYTQKQVYDMLNIRQSTFSAWETGRAEPSADMLLKLCKLYNVKDIFAAFGYDGYNDDGSLRLNMYEVDLVEKYRDLDDHGRRIVDMVLEEEYTRSIAPKEATTIYNLPYSYDLAASAGTGEYAMDIAHFKTVGLSEKPPKGADFLIRVSGNSMEPKFSNNDKVFIKRMDAIGIGEIGLFYLNGDVYIKKQGDGELISLNPEYKPISVNEFSSIKCFGKVLGKCECEIIEV